MLSVSDEGLLCVHYSLIVCVIGSRGEGKIAAPEVHVTRAAEGYQEGARHRERRQGCYRGKIQSKIKGLF